MSIASQRAILRIPNTSASNAKKSADLFLKTNTDSKGNPTIEGYQGAINYLISSGAGSTVDGQVKIAAYQNAMKALQAKESDASSTVASLQQKEYAAWYVDEEGDGSTGLRNPGYVAQTTSESLDMLIAETVQTIAMQKESNKDTSATEDYLDGLLKRADRMRSITTDLANGKTGNLDGYGYYVDTDPNTGAIRGASFIPTDIAPKGLDTGKVRTNSFVQVGGAQVPVYVPYIKDENGQTISNFGGKQYIGDTNLLSADGAEQISLSDTNSFKYGGDQLEKGKIYVAPTGKLTKIGQQPEQTYYYVGHDDKLYNFNDGDPAGMKLIDDLRASGAIGDTKTPLPRVNPYTIKKYGVTPLPSEESFATSQIAGAQRQVKIQSLQQQAAQSQQEADDFSVAKETFFGLPQAAGQVGTAIAKAPLNTFKGLSSFFGKKNRPNKPDQPPPARTGNDVIQSARDIFNA